MIECLYSCPSCGLADVKVSVKERGWEDVVEWMEKTCIPTIGADHALRSPTCRTKSLSKLKIPVPLGTTRVGSKPSS